MKNIKWRMNLFLTFMTVLGIYIFFTFDKYELNYMLFGSDDVDFVIDEVLMASKEKVIGNNVSLLSNNPVSNKWVIPVDGNYVITTYYNYSHRAVDLYSYKGYDSKVMAANSGEVIGVFGNCIAGDSSCNGRRGNYVVIRHNVNNYYTVYMHLHNIYVRVGDKVDSGSVIGTMGNTGNVIPMPSSSNPYGGTHLHFCLFVGEPYKGGYAINPMSLY